ncbi:MAG: DUF86 domain-containing protein [Desulfuromonadales bacterium]|nr:DUF86 domain-containing protein [Desulfuromonadales bacterium]
MNAKDKIILQKIQKYIREAISYTQGMTFGQFMGDGRTVSAVAFAASQMGELANNISPKTRELYPTLPWKELRGMRNRIIHDYENIDFNMLWQTVTEDFPALLKELDHLALGMD